MSCVFSDFFLDHSNLLREDDSREQARDMQLRSAKLQFCQFCIVLRGD